MATRRDKPLAREIDLNRTPQRPPTDALGLSLTPKGRRKGSELRWAHLLSGEAALATAPNASLGRLEARK